MADLLCDSVLQGDDSEDGHTKSGDGNNPGNPGNHKGPTGEINVMMRDIFIGLQSEMS